MKKHFPLVVTLLVLAGVASTLRLPRNPDVYDVTAASQFPVLVNGRVKPLDTVARTSLLMIQGRQRVRTPDGVTLAPTEWLLDVLYRPARADTYQTFEIVHPDLLNLLNLSPAEGSGGKRFSVQQMRGRFAELDRQAKLADGTETAVRTPFQRAVVQLRNALVLYQHLQTTVLAPGSADFLADFERLERALPSAAPVPNGHNPHGSAEAKLMLEMATAFATMDQLAYLHPVPPAPGEAATAWKSVGAAWTTALTTGKIAPGAKLYVELGRAWHDRQPDAFNRVVHAQQAVFARDLPGAVRKSGVETRFNAAQPFYSSAVLYVIGFLLAMISWLRWPEFLGRIARRLVAIAFAISTLGILTRMWLEARPPVTNLYSSALFVGWGAVALCLVLERFFRNSIGTVAGGVIGFATLLIAHHLALGGDTMEMMRAVLDSNFWLTTHVVTIAIGYSATFLAGFLAVIYVARGVLTRSLDQTTASSLSRMIYGIVCFATLFSFIGTILGGIWADQSWGRFWGWDPKENGALLIVLWNSMLLHARWGGYVQPRGLAVMAIFGNIVTAWSWFGVNMLGVGLHSYGFMDSAFWWLVGFAASQAVLMLLAALPATRWRSASLLARRAA